MPISGDAKEYMIGLDDFKSIASNAKIDLKDITTIVFIIVPPSAGKSSDIQLGFSNISYSKEDINYINSLIRFKSDAAKMLQLKISDAVTGRVVFTKQVNAIRGENIVPVIMDNNGSQKVMIINPDGTGIDSSKYKATKVIAENIKIYYIHYILSFLFTF